MEPLADASIESPGCCVMRRMFFLVGALLGVLVMVFGCDSEEESISPKSTAEAGVSAALDRYQAAKSTGSRQDILACLTSDSPQRALLAGSDEDFAVTREVLDDAQYSERFVKRRDYKIVDNYASLVADVEETRSDRTDDRKPTTSTAEGILVEAREVNGQWLIHDVLSRQRQIMRDLGSN